VFVCVTLRQHFDDKDRRHVLPADSLEGQVQGKEAVRGHIGLWRGGAAASRHEHPRLVADELQNVTMALPIRLKLEENPQLDDAIRRIRQRGHVQPPVDEFVLKTLAVTSGLELLQGHEAPMIRRAIPLRHRCWCAVPALLLDCDGHGYLNSIRYTVT